MAREVGTSTTTTVRLLVAVGYSMKPVELATVEIPLVAVGDGRLPDGSAGVLIRMGKRGLRRELRRALRKAARAL
ncbi:MAG: hypothetical protein P0Y60_14535 [Candidatus Microbacterium colombiense]|nr:MAG: hypothetical protein P0Y60_14535 [Microbacterium sp.]